MPYVLVRQPNGTITSEFESCDGCAYIANGGYRTGRNILTPETRAVCDECREREEIKRAAADKHWSDYGK